MRDANRRTLSLIAAIFVLPLLASNFIPQRLDQSNPQAGPPFRDDGQLVFIRQGTHTTIKMIQIEIADNDAERAQGLMWRRYMAEDDGMLFIFRTQELQTFWMKNTYIPLDMIFADSSGRIVSIYPEATPLNETSIPSGEPAKYVVEVNGGFCARFGINVGDRIEYER